MYENFLSSSSKASEEYILRAIESTKSNNFTEIDFKSMNICKIPQDLLQLHQLQRISLYGSKLSSLPDAFYDSFPYLKWLDFRCNKLRSISRNINKFRCLTNLLVGNNYISRLCLEIGDLENLIGFNIEGNPLKFPSQEILLKGPSHVLDYIKKCLAKRRELENKSSKAPISLEFRTRTEEPSSITMNGFSQICDSENINTSQNDFDRLAIESVNNELKLNAINKQKKLPWLYKSKSYRHFKRNAHNTDKFKKSIFDFPQQSQRHALTHKKADNLVSCESLQEHESEHIYLHDRKTEKSRQDRILQRIKDQEMIHNWKTDYRIRQSALANIYGQKVWNEIKKESTHRILAAPYDINAEAISVMTRDNLELLKTAPHPGISFDPRPKPRSAISLLKLEAERRHKDENLIEDIHRQAELINLKIDNPCLPLSVPDAEADLIKVLQLQLRLKNRLDVITQLKTATNPTAFLH